jgi:hypothetical protein
MAPLLVALLTVAQPAPAGPPVESGSTKEIREAALAEATQRGGKQLNSPHVDARVSVDTDVLLVYVDLGVSADFGLIPLGPGTLAIGAGFDLGFCGSFCWGLSALLSAGFKQPTTYSQNHYFPQARVTYHLPVAEWSTSALAKKINIYALLAGGPVISNLRLSTQDNSLLVEGNNVSVGISGGAGAEYFLGERFFVGLEAQLRYARGVYNWNVKVGNYALSDSEQTWNLSGFNLKFFLGIRI